MSSFASCPPAPESNIREDIQVGIYYLLLLTCSMKAPVADLLSPKISFGWNQEIVRYKMVRHLGVFLAY